MMTSKPGMRLVPRGLALGLILVAAVVMVIVTSPAEAVDLSPSSGKFRLNIDTTLSWGALYRVADRDPALISALAYASPTEMGTAWGANGDDGNLNFDKGIVSNTLKATVDVDLSGKNFGIFLRGSGFYDYELEQNDRERTQLGQDALDWAGNRYELLDAFLWWQFQYGSKRGELRVGQQVLNWGESTYISGGLSVINPVDLSALRLPGSELKEAYRPVGMVVGSFDLTQNLAVEAFYQYEFEEIVVDPPGTYFSTNDFAGIGGERIFLAFASFPDTGETPWFITTPSDHPFISVPRSPNQMPDDGGQYGLALRWFVPQLGGTEFGFYYLNYHSRLPVVNGITGTVEGAIAAGAAGQATAAYAYQYFGVAPGDNPEIDATVSTLAGLAAVDTFAQTSSYYVTYPEDIKLYGLSWNAQLGTSGVAFQGELAYRQDNPLLMDDVEALFAALSPLSERYANASQITRGVPYGFGQDAVGYRLFDTAQLQFTMSRIFSSMFGADQWVVLGEFGFNKVFDMPSKDELRFDGPGTLTSGNPDMMLPTGLHPGKEWERPEHFADDFSWGYRLVTKLTYNNALGAWSLAPFVSWQHDVDGITPGPGGAFIADRKAVTVGVTSVYQNSWQIDLKYTNYFGAGRWNVINDRDFVGGFVKYAF